MGLCASREAVFHKLFDVDETAPPLGEGAYATVFAGRHRRTGEPIVVKRVAKTAAAEESLGEFWHDEASTLQQCTPHPNIVELLHVYETPTHAYMVTEMAQGGELFQALISEGAYSEWDAKRFTRDIFEALCRIHSEQIVHRDIKPENLLLTSKDTTNARIKLGDFRSAMPLQGTSHFDCSKLTWAYCAPEILRELLTLQQQQQNQQPNADSSQSKPKVPNPSATPKSDMWSVGIVLYVLLSGTHPFDPDGRQTKDQIITNILRSKYSLSESPSLWESDEISKEAKALLGVLLQADPAQRPTAEEALAHAWFHDPTTPRNALQVSISNGLGAYQLLMQKKFRTSVLVALAAQSLRRSLFKIRASKTGSGLQGLETAGVDDHDKTRQDGDSTGAGAMQMERQPSGAVRKLFGREELRPETTENSKQADDRDDKASEQQSLDLIDEFDGDITRAAETVP